MAKIFMVYKLEQPQGMQGYIRWQAKSGWMVVTNLLVMVPCIVLAVKIKDEVLKKYDEQ